MELNKIYNQDNVQGLKEHIDDNSIDLTVTSPPYDDLREYGGHDWNFKPLARQLYRVTRDGGVVVWIVGDTTKDFCETLSSFRQAIYFVEEVGFKLLDTMIYQKRNYPPAYPNIKRYASTFEYMFILVKGRKPKSFNELKEAKSENSIGKESTSAYRQKDGSLKKRTVDISNKEKARTNVWNYMTGAYANEDEVKFNHPATFPNKLAKDHIKSWSNEGDIVLDPFMGSGTAAKMAKKLDRKYIGFEINKEYCEIAERRTKEIQKTLID